MGRTTKEDYARHYRDYQSKPSQIKNRAQRNAARTDMEKERGAAAVAGKDVHHSTPIRSGGTNSKKNLKLRKPGSNRGWK